MGYTHYWTQTKSFAPEDWVEVCAEVGEVLKNVQHVQNVPLADAMGKARTTPEITDKHIRFNGVGDNSHETFVLNRVIVKEEHHSEAGWDFTKTARKPYDVAVTAILCYLSSVWESHSVSSDGHGEDFQAGLLVARQALPKYANVLDIPIDILKEDRWCGPWASHQGDKYQLRFCVDGHAYIIRLKDGKAYQFPTHKEAAAFAEECRDPTGDAPGWGNTKRGKPTGKYSVFKTSGSFDKIRTDQIKREQTRVLKAKFEHGVHFAPERMVQPPLFVRPGDIPNPPEHRAYHFADLLKETAE